MRHAVADRHDPGSDGHLQIGNSENVYVEKLAGKIGDVKIFSTAHSATQIQGEM